MRGIVLLFALLLTLTVTAQPRRVLFVGNSYTEVNNLPQMIANVAHSMGDEITYSSNTPGGCTFMQHCQNASMEMIVQGGWDVVVLQEQSQYPSFPQSQVENEVFPYAQQLVTAVYAHNPCAEPMFYMTWGRKNGDSHNAQFFPVLGTYEGMDSMLCLRYQQMAADNDAALCPVGRVWRMLRTEHPEIELYQSDGSHPSVAGSYAAACAFYVMLFHRDPNGIGYDAGLDATDADNIRQAVRVVVFERLTEWQRPQPEAQLTAQHVGNGDTVWFSYHCDHADTLLWQFGDGTEEAEPYVAGTTKMHVYAGTGDFVIRLAARRHCMEAVDSTTIHVAASGTDPVGISVADKNRVVVYPNPTGDNATVMLDAPALLTLLTLEGRQLWRSHAPAGLTTIPLQLCPSGIYCLRINNPAGTRTVTLVKVD